ncbi:MAG: hypothetical protein QNK35_18190, partial [Bacteroides sp.]|nr:hypothetical protein [Bacteroides sp.]
LKYRNKIQACHGAYHNQAVLTLEYMSIFQGSDAIEFKQDGLGHLTILLKREVTLSSIDQKGSIPFRLAGRKKKNPRNDE